MKSSDPRPWSVGEVAARFELPTNVLRHWETVGLLAPERDTAGRRRYGEDEVVRIAVILRSKAAGMSLEQISLLLDGGNAGRHVVLHSHLEDLDRRMAEMRRSREMVEHSLRCRSHDIATCPRFRAGVDDVLARFPGRDPADSAADSAADSTARVSAPAARAAGPAVRPSPFSSPDA
ncbi:DNA-binding transcriptional MerR regulator [Microbacterium resistens]|uniref:DNA-binding transcriptional MerR regulator n=1 Tax=Microbacterium resistens TaxID=156977 RepID=A0ABU1SDK7_9MICO|nr:MerR family transcriptional regulator [Microbacterium resistens]MDR6867318.1 DNA-binding transcriptional MerR regulator [Microbacterium resistens]